MWRVTGLCPGFFFPFSCPTSILYCTFNTMRLLYRHPNSRPPPSLPGKQRLHLQQSTTGRRYGLRDGRRCPGNEAARASLLPGDHVADDVRGAAPGKTRLVAVVCVETSRQAGWRNFPPETAASPAPSPL